MLVLAITVQICQKQNRNTQAGKPWQATATYTWEVQHR